MKKLTQLFLIMSAVVLLSQLSCDLFPDREKTPSPNIPVPVVAIYPTAAYINLPDRATFDGTKYPLYLHRILLPYNCPASFVIVNEGPIGSVLKYSIADNGALGGFLDYTNGVGSLRSGEYSTITVTVDTNFTKSGFGGLGYDFGTKEPGSELVLNISTPDASNLTKAFVMVPIIDYDVEVQKICGLWSGTWSGLSDNGHKTMPVNGTWELNIQSVDWANETASGTLIWNGRNAWWDYYGTDSAAENSLPHYYDVDRTLIFNKYNTTLKGTGSAFNSPCGTITLYVAGSKPLYPEPYPAGVAPDPFAPMFFIEIPTDFKSVNPGYCTGWTQEWLSQIDYITWGYSGGELFGSKSP